MKILIGPEEFDAETSDNCYDALTGVQSAIDRIVIIEDWVDRDDEELVFQKVKRTAFNSETSENLLKTGTARSRVPQAVLSRSTDGSYYPRMDNRRPRISSTYHIQVFYHKDSSLTTKEPRKLLNLWGQSAEDRKDYAIMTVDALEIYRSGSFLRAPRKNDVYSLDLKNIIPLGGITVWLQRQQRMQLCPMRTKTGACQFKISTSWFLKAISVRVYFKDIQACITHCLACKKGLNSTGHRARRLKNRLLSESTLDSSYGFVWSVSVESVNRKKYCLVVTDDCSKFSWVFFLAYKDETYDMLHDLIVGLENKLRHKKGIKREYSIARTPQQNGVAERKNRTLIEAARTMQRYLGVYNRDTRKGQDCSLCNFLGTRRIKGEKVLDWMFDLDLLTPIMNYISCKERKLCDSKEKGMLVIDVDELADQQFIVYTSSAYASRGQYAAKEVQCL
ncbi:putative ribonuclease H-like domain-containing protein [Tanacetum coccineum]|uniref:Ribonuclease H-like domain-containing protein n=1 Tax=Tanacetum coccineum TaxID=301880 RepID=A0ABQ5BU51_9ASTR